MEREREMERESLEDCEVKSQLSLTVEESK